MRLLPLCLIASALFAQKVTVEADESVDFSTFKTFAIRQGRLNSKHPALNSELTKKKIESEITSRLTARGLTAVTGATADLNVFYHLGAARKTEVESYSVGWRGRGRRLVRVPYSEGTLVIDLRDTTAKALVWRGVASVEEREAAKIEGKIDDMVKKALDKYPPKRK